MTHLGTPMMTGRLKKILKTLRMWSSSQAGNDPDRPPLPLPDDSHGHQPDEQLLSHKLQLLLKVYLHMLQQMHQLMSHQQSSKVNSRMHLLQVPQIILSLNPLLTLSYGSS